MGSRAKPRQALQEVDAAEMALRSAYMRLYKSWWDDHICYPASLLDEATAERLLAAGHIAAIWHGEELIGWKLTEDGIHAWAWINEPYMKRWKRHALTADLYDPLRWIVGLIKFEDMCERSQEKMNELTNAQKRILETLQDGETHHFGAGQAGLPMKRLREVGYVEQVVKGQWRITPKGVGALKGSESVPVDMQDGEGAAAAEPYQPMTPILSPRPFRAEDYPTAQPTSPKREEKPRTLHPLAVSEQHANGTNGDRLPADEQCEGCMRRKVLDLLVESLPEAKELYALLVRQEIVLARLRSRGNGNG